MLSRCYPIKLAIAQIYGLSHHLSELNLDLIETMRHADVRRADSSSPETGSPT